MAFASPLPDDVESPLGDVRSRLAQVGWVARTLIGALVLMWAIELLDTFVLGDRLQANGIRPRRTDGLDGILWAPFLHGGFFHLIGNSVPFLMLGGFVGLRGARYWATIATLGVVVGGGLTWLLAVGDGNHIGASGVVYAFFGAILTAAVVERRPGPAAIAIVTIVLYSSFFIGLIPQGRISWEGHLFGAIAGGIGAKLMAEPRPPKRQLDEPPLDDPYWEV